MGAIYNSIPTELAERLQRAFDIKVFVESGLGQGTSALWAERHFDTCISIEIDSILVEQFKSRHTQSNVRIIEGNSGVAIAEIMSSLVTPALFWLDGHTDDYTPVLTEIASINASTLDHIIWIDDARLFNTLSAWPNYDSVIMAAKDGARRFVLEHNDIIMAFQYKTLRLFENILLKGTINGLSL